MENLFPIRLDEQRHHVGILLDKIDPIPLLTRWRNTRRARLCPGRHICCKQWILGAFQCSPTTPRHLTQSARRRLKPEEIDSVRTPVKPGSKHGPVRCMAARRAGPKFLPAIAKPMMVSRGSKSRRHFRRDIGIVIKIRIFFKIGRDTHRVLPAKFIGSVAALWYDSRIDNAARRQPRSQDEEDQSER